MIESESDFKKLIQNYKYNIKAKKLSFNDSELTVDHIINKLDTNQIISYSYGRFLRILSNFQLFNKETKFIDVNTSFGKDLVSEFLYLEYKQEKIAKNITNFE
jgi:hypothetical protein